jgi:hypothetical protein
MEDQIEEGYLQAITKEKNKMIKLELTCTKEGFKNVLAALAKVGLKWSEIIEIMNNCNLEDIDAENLDIGAGQKLLMSQVKNLF